jgi:hypothetical protein
MVVWFALQQQASPNPNMVIGGFWRLRDIVFKQGR